MSQMIAPTPGFALKTFRLNREGQVTDRKVFINVCYHSCIDRPLLYSGTPATDAMLDSHGLDSLQVPLFLGPLRITNDHSGVASDVIDVLFNQSVVQRCLNLRHPLRPRFIQRVSALSISFIEQDNPNVKLCQKCIVLNAKYKGMPCPIAVADIGTTGSQRRGGSGDVKEVDIEESRTLTADVREEIGMSNIRIPRTTAMCPDRTPKIVELPSEEDSSQKPPKIEEINTKKDDGEATSSSSNAEKGKTSSDPVIKKGFLLNSKEVLYPEGSQNGELPPNAGNPLGWMPPGLLNRCKVIDPTNPGPNATSSASTQPKEPTGKLFTDDEERKLAEVDSEEFLKELARYMPSTLSKDVAASSQAALAGESLFDAFGGIGAAPRNNTNKANSKKKDEPYGVDDDIPDYAKPAPKAKTLADMGLTVQPRPEDTNSNVKKGSTEPKRKVNFSETVSSSDQPQPPKPKATQPPKSADSATPAAASVSTSSPPPTSQKLSQKPSEHIPQYTLKDLDAEKSGLVVVIQLPGIASAAEIDADVTSERVILKAPGFAPLNLTFPYSIDADDMGAKFNKKRAELSLTLHRSRP